MIIFTRQCNNDLYKKSMNIIEKDIDKIPMRRYNKRNGARKYLLEVLNHPEEIKINLDEDVFLYREESIDNLINYMIKEDYDYCGVSDGGVNVRSGHPLVTNPFFNIFRNRIKIEGDDYKSFNIYNPDYEKKIPWDMITEPYDIHKPRKEKYYPLLGYLSIYYKCLYLNCRTDIKGDNLSTTVLDHNGNDFLIHTWYARFYNKNEEHTQRINNAYKVAQERKAKWKKKPTKP